MSVAVGKEMDVFDLDQPGKNRQTCCTS